MSKRIFTSAELEKLKREAKKIKKSKGVSHVEALNRIAAREGFETWWHLQHLSDPKKQPVPQKQSAPGDNARPIVRFTMDPKDTEELDDELLASRGFARDEDFTDKVNDELAADQHPDDPWEAAHGMFAAFRFIDWPSDDLGEITSRIQDAFFFFPDDVWIGDKKVSRRDLIKSNPASAIIQGAEVGLPGSAVSIIYELLPELAAKIKDESTVINAMAETNAESFGFDSGDIESAEFDDDGKQIAFAAFLTLSGTQDVDRPFCGDKIDLDVNGVAVRSGEKWFFTAIEIERVRTNA